MTKTGISVKKTTTAVSTAIFLKLRFTFIFAFDKDASMLCFIF